MTPFRQGDLVEFDFSPSRGHEPAGRRPGLVASSDKFNWSTHMTRICPVTTRDNGLPLHLALPEDLDERYGFVVVEQVRAFDLDARNAVAVARLDRNSPTMRHFTSLLKSFF